MALHGWMGLLSERIYRGVLVAASALLAVHPRQPPKRLARLCRGYVPSRAIADRGIRRACRPTYCPTRHARSSTPLRPRNAAATTQHRLLLECLWQSGGRITDVLRLRPGPGRNWRRLIDLHRGQCQDL
jgi:hypothetical protein